MPLLDADRDLTRHSYYAATAQREAPFPALEGDVTADVAVVGGGLAGLSAAIELQPIEGSPGKRAFDVFLDCWERGVLIRTTGDTIALSPPLIIEKQHIEQLVGTIADVLKQSA